MAPKTGIRSVPVSILITVLCCCHACKQGPDLPGEILKLGTGTADNTISINLPESVSGCVTLRMNFQKYSRGFISFSGQSCHDSSVVVFNYPFNLVMQSYPNKLVPYEDHYINCDWNLLNSRLKIFMDSSLQTIRMAENDELVSINKITIQNTSDHFDSSDLKIQFTGSDLTRGRLTENRIRIIAFGNSTTAYRRSITAVYAQRLPDRLFNEGIANIVFNKGIPGSHTGHLSENSHHNIKHGLDRFDESVVSKDPDIVIICFGINDSWIDEGKKRPRIPKENYQRNLSFMLDAMGARNIFTILMTPNKMGSRFPQWRNENLSGYARIVRNINRQKIFHW